MCTECVVSLDRRAVKLPCSSGLSNSGLGSYGLSGNEDSDFAADQKVFHNLLEHRKEITRTVKKIDKGIEAVTQSENSEVTKKIQEHVDSMHERVKNGRGIHLRDPLFAALFKNYKKITMTVAKTEKGIKVVETSEEPFVAKLIQLQAEVISKFIENGHEEVQKYHEVPK